MLNASKDLDGYKKHDGITVKLRNLNASKKLESENTLRDRNKKRILNASKELES